MRPRRKIYNTKYRVFDASLLAPHHHLPSSTQFPCSQGHIFPTTQFAAVFLPQAQLYHYFKKNNFWSYIPGDTSPIKLKVLPKAKKTLLRAALLRAAMTVTIGCTGHQNTQLHEIAFIWWGTCCNQWPGSSVWSSSKLYLNLCTLESVGDWDRQLHID